MTDNNLCPSCNHSKEHDGKSYNDKTLCHYCYFRSNESTMKMVILNILDTSAVRLDKADIQDAFNILPYIGYPMHIKDIEALLLRYKFLGLITGRKNNIKSTGRKRLLYKITIKGHRWVARANKRWKQGNPIHVPRKNKKETKFRMTSNYLERASAIRGKIGKEYDTYEYIFARRRKL